MMTPIGGRARGGSRDATGGDTHGGRSSAGRTGSPAPRAGFSAIETVVLVAILATLGVLSYGAVQTLRANGRFTRCMDNVKKLGVGVQGFKETRKGYGMPGAPNAFCDGAGGISGQFIADQNAGKAPNTLWTSTPQSGNLKQRVGFIPFAAGPSRFSNHGYLYKGQHVVDVSVYSCPDMEGLYTAGDDDVDGFNRTLKPYLPDAADRLRWDPPGDLAPRPAGELAWMSSYDYRSCFEAGSSLGWEFYVEEWNRRDPNYKPPPPSYRGPYDPINLGQQSAETAVFVDTLQNPGNRKLAHGNVRYNTVFGDGHVALVKDEGRVERFGLTNPVTGTVARTIAELNLSIATTKNYWSLNERIWNEIISKP